jgi:hypothetical protein
MHAVRAMGQPLLRLLAALAIAASLAVACGAAQATASSAARGPNGCDPYLDGTVIPVPCSSGSAGAGISSAGSGTAGSAGGAGSSATSNLCRTVELDKAGAQSLGLSWPPPPGKSWGLLDCLGGGIGPLAVLVSNATVWLAWPSGSGYRQPAGIPGA